MRNVIKTIWEHILYLWKNRNEVLHSKLKTTSPQKFILIKTMKTLYTKHQTHQGNYKFLFKHSVQEISLNNQHHLERWIDLVKMIPESEHINNIQRKSKGSNIKKYLPSSSKPPDQNPK